MGDLIVLDERRRRRAAPLPRPAAVRAAFFFDIACPFSYLAAERVERELGSVSWIPTSAHALRGGELWGDPASSAAALVRAERRALELRLPLVWPERFPAPVPMALRAAAYAAENGAAPAFALAGARLAFCGGFDLEDPEILAEAAAAAGLRLDDCLAAAGDSARDLQLLEMARELGTRGAHELPAVMLGAQVISGERRLPEAAAALRAGPSGSRAVPLG